MMVLMHWIKGWFIGVWRFIQITFYTLLAWGILIIPLRDGWSLWSLLTVLFVILGPFALLEGDEFDD